MISWMRLNIYTNSNLITNTSVYFGSFEIKLAHTITSLYYGSFDKWFSNCKNTILHLETTTRSTITYTVIISFRVYFLFLGLKDQFLGEWAQLWLKNIVFLKPLTVPMKPERHAESKFPSPSYGSFDLNTFFETFARFNQISTVFFNILRVFLEIETRRKWSVFLKPIAEN